MRVVLALWAAHEAMVVVCSAWWMFEPWSVPVGQPMCSVRAGFDLGAVGIFAVLCVCIWITNKKAE